MRVRGLRHQQNSQGLWLDLSIKFQKNLKGNKYKAVTTLFFQEGFDVLCLMSFRGKKNTSLLSQVLLKVPQNLNVKTHHQYLIHNLIARPSASLSTLFNKVDAQLNCCPRYNWEEISHFFQILAELMIYSTMELDFIMVWVRIQIIEPPLELLGQVEVYFFPQNMKTYE